MTGHSNTGAWNLDNFLCRLIAGCIDIGKAPIEQMSFDIVPVDYVSKAIVYLSLQPQAVDKTFHFNNKSPVKSGDIVAWMNAFGYQVKQVPYANGEKVSWRLPNNRSPTPYIRFFPSVKEKSLMRIDQLRYEKNTVRSGLKMHYSKVELNLQTRIASCFMFIFCICNVAAY